MAAGVGRPRHRRRPRHSRTAPIKAAIAAAAGVDPRPELERALRAGIVTDEPRRGAVEQTKRRRRSGGSDDQLSMW
ncbi:hypothetical protein GS497_26115 [Rhodococcus hoagii]|nr:hypothetical protein [Prescottella equi]